MRHVVLSLVLVCFTSVSAIAQATKQPFTTEDVLNVVKMSRSDITADGAFAAATFWTDRDRKNVDHMRFGDPTYISPSFGKLVVIDAADGSVQSVFDERVQVRNARWSPDGRTLAFFLLESDRYALYTYDRERDRTHKVALDTDKEIASNSTLGWRPEGSGVLIALRASGWREASREAYRELSFGPTIVQDSRDDFLSWDAVRARGSLTIPAMVDLDSRDVRELLPEGRYNGFIQSDDGRYLSFSNRRRSGPCTSAGRARTTKS